ncbi:hypothetical protein GALMADRAFT_136151 [Galerina marginata CBS 339.88]|uniref:F-box domain-containing protein n=1 Tax=Galerina marginata (strain CBS 339.88) TaxID=685588 RepID=A0A067TFG7_GALM3|nr:hypothetical protein GALMADRAFT_136151 [Galerina marginata CBS 339.88]
MPPSGSSQSSSSNSTAPISCSLAGTLAAAQAQIRGGHERADAILEGLQAPDNCNRPVIVASKYLLGPHEATPIHKLHDDLLWHVFMLNADMLPVKVSELGYCGQWDAMNVTRRTSQVCNRWRELAINSPSLWGRCVDLRRLNQVEPHWRNEVLRRTGESLLHIKGRIVSLDLGSFLLHLLNTSWERIRALEVELRPFDAIIADPRWAVLQRPAPALQSFSLSFDDVVPNILRTPEVPIFGGHAPVLVKFVLRDGGIVFRIPSLGFFQIRRLEIGGAFTIPGLFKALSNMSRLEYLQVHQTPRTDTTPSTLPHIICPQLSHIHLNSTLDSCLKMLEHITAAPGSGLIVFCPDTSGIQIENLDGRLSTALSRYTQNFFDLHTVSKLSMQLMSLHFLFECDADSSISRPRPQLFFNTESFALRPMHSGIYDALLGVFSACQLTNISTLSIHLSPCNYTPTTAGNMSFISSFSSVETLSTTAQFLDILLAKSNDKCLFFPSLKTLKYMSDPLGAPNFDTVKNFLFQRQEAAVPVDLLIIKTSRQPSNEARQLFKMFTGLEVIWVRHGMSDEEFWGKEDAEVHARLNTNDTIAKMPSAFKFLE